MASRTGSSSAHYQFHDLGEGIRWGEARREGTALANTGIIDLGGSTLVFDTSLTLASAHDILGACRSLTGRGPSLAVNSHWHLDHILGNQLFADHPIYATSRTLEVLLEKRAELEKELAPATLTAEIEDLEKRSAAATTDAGRAIYADVIRLNRGVLAELVELRITPPTVTFDGTFRLPGSLGAELRSFGAAHTANDGFLFVPKQRILFAADVVVVGSHPNLASGDPSHWLRVLDELEALRPERIVPGHGPVAGPEAIELMRDYLSTVLELAKSPSVPEVPSRFRDLRGSDMFSTNVAYARSLRPAENGRGGEDAGSSRP
jgi:cyclase